MKFSIGLRLFFAVLLSIAAVAVVGVEFVRWQLFDNFSDHPIGNEFEQLGGLTDALSTQYRAHHDWSFLSVDASERKSWLREQLQRLPARPGQSSSLVFRVGLLDRNGNYLAGAIASPILVAITSIDTLQRPLVVDGRSVGFLVVSKPQNPNDELAVAFLVQQQRNLAIVAAISLLMSALVAVLLAAHFRKPIRQLVAGARQLEAARFDTRLSIRRSDELGELAVSFNHLAARLEAVDESRRQWIADTAHELRTPLSVLRGQIEALQDGVRTATPENIALLLRQVEVLSQRVEEIYDLARADVGQMHYDKSVNQVWPIFADAQAAYSEKLRGAGLTATTGPAPARSEVLCDAGRIRQVATNLLENSVRYTASGGCLQMRANIVGDEIRIDIDDSAPAVPGDALARLGERFFRVDSSRVRQLGGAGLGLALCRQILAAHDGRLEFAASALGGLRVTVVLKLDA